MFISRKLILRMQVGYNCLLYPTKELRMLLLPMTYKGFKLVALMYINTLWLDIYVNS